MLRGLTRTLLIVAFLVAQTAGMAHQIWHDAGAQVADAGIDGAVDGKAPKKSPLCDFHTALASVLGAMSGSHAASEAIVSPQAVFLAADVPATRLSTLAPQSRAPPTLL
jgi:hypothetical protein